MTFAGSISVRRRTRSFRSVASICFLFALSVVTLSNLLFIILVYKNLFVHPHFFDDILPLYTKDGLGFQWSDLLTPFQSMSPIEFRPRFLAYGIEGLDIRLRFILYKFVPVHPTMSVAWILEILVGPLCLYGLVVNLTESRSAAIVATSIYLTSVGFLSGIAMLILPGKALAGVALILVMYLASELLRRKTDDQLLFYVNARHKYVLLIILFLGLFLDEMPLFAFVLLPIVFAELFVPARPTRNDLYRSAINLGIFSTPIVLFLGFVLVVAPLITMHFFNYKFQYVDSILNIGQLRGKSLLEGPYGSFGLGVVYGNVMSLFGTSIVPYQISPMVPFELSSNFVRQANNMPKIVIMLVFGCVLGVVAWNSPREGSARVRRILLATGLFIVFHSLVSIRHIPVTNGYYYGAAFAVFFALISGVGWAEISKRGEVAKILCSVAILLVCLVQIGNFSTINRSWSGFHNKWAADAYVRRHQSSNVRIAQDGPLSRKEVRTIWHAWKAGGLASYLKEHSVSSSALYLLVELEHIDRNR